MEKMRFLRIFMANVCGRFIEFVILMCCASIFLFFVISCFRLYYNLYIL